MTTASPRPDDYRFHHRLRVRWAEVDMQGIVFNGHYLMYVDCAIADYWRALAMPYADAMHRLGGDLVVRRSTLDYLAPARYDEQLDIGLRCLRVGNSSLTYEASVFRGEQRLLGAEVVYVFTDPSLSGSRPVPQDLRALVEGWEKGEPVVEVRTGDWDSLGRDAQAIRTEVFVQEQKIPAELEWDAGDAHCVHAVAYNRLGMPVATGRLLEHVPGVAKVGRMAVRQAVRGARVGEAVLQALMEAARRRGDREVLLHAQRSAVPFYLRQGFQPRGPQFEEAGIAHQEMVRAL